MLAILNAAFIATFLGLYKRSYRKDGIPKNAVNNQGKIIKKM